MPVKKSIQNPIDFVYCLCGESEYCKITPELEFSILSLRRNVPWLRYIWIIVPDNYNTGNLKGSDIKHVHESTIVPKKYLPTHNSNVVESWIWRLKGLSDLFVYMNDDMYIGRPVSPSDFFTGPQGTTPILRLEPGPTRHPRLEELTGQSANIPYVRMWAGAITKYNLDFTRIQHQALPQRVSILTRLYKQYKKAVDEASNNKHRSGEFDFNLVRFASPMAVMSGDSYLQVTDTSIDFFMESDDYANIKKVPRIKPKFFCINNNGPDNKIVYKMLANYFKA